MKELIDPQNKVGFFKKIINKISTVVATNDNVAVAMQTVPSYEESVVKFEDNFVAGIADDVQEIINDVKTSSPNEDKANDKRAEILNKVKPIIPPKDSNEAITISALENIVVKDKAIMAYWNVGTNQEKYFGHWGNFVYSISKQIHDKLKVKIEEMFQTHFVSEFLPDRTVSYIWDRPLCRQFVDLYDKLNIRTSPGKDFLDYFVETRKDYHLHEKK